MSTIKLALTTDLVHISSKVKIKTFQYIVLNLALFIVPFTLGHPQILVGSMVNAMLIYLAINFKGYKLIPGIFLPALAVLSQGLIFGSLTKYLVVFIPFIWVSNFIIIFSVRFCLLNGRSKLQTFMISSFFKAAFLFGIAFFLIGFFDFPKIFVVAMGPVQFLTATIGSGIYLSSYSVCNFLAKFLKK